MIKELTLAMLLATNSVYFNYNYNQVEAYQWSNTGIINNDADITISISPAVLVQKTTQTSSGTFSIKSYVINDNINIDSPTYYYYQSTKDVAVSNLPYQGYYMLNMDPITLPTFNVNDKDNIAIIYNELMNVYAMKSKNYVQILLHGTDESKVNVLFYYVNWSINVKYDNNSYAYSWIDLGIETNVATSSLISNTSFGGVKLVDNQLNTFKASNKSDQFNLNKDKLNIISFMIANQQYMYLNEITYNWQHFIEIKQVLDGNNNINKELFNSNYYLGARTISDGSIAPPANSDDLIPTKQCNGALDIPCQVGNGLASLVNNIPFVSNIFKNIKTILQVPILLFERLIKGIFNL